MDVKKKRPLAETTTPVCFSLLLTLVGGAPLIQVWRSFLQNTFNVHSHTQNTESKSTSKNNRKSKFQKPRFYAF